MSAETASDLDRLYFGAPLQKIDTGDATLALRQYGSGPALLLIHGFPLHGYTWRRLLPTLSRHFTCYVPDLAGKGDSEWRDDTAFNFEDHARRLKRLVDQLGLTRYATISQDTGGTVARALALIDPERTSRMLLLNTEMPGHRPPWIPLYQFSTRLPGSQATFRLLLRSRAFRRSGMGFGGCFVNLDLIDGEFHQHFVQPVLDSPRRLEGVLRYLGGLTWPFVDALADNHRRMTMPVQLLWGEDDPTFPIALARQMAAQFPNATLVAVPRTKLLLHEERPEAVLDAALAFLRD